MTTIRSNPAPARPPVERRRHSGPARRKGPGEPGRYTPRAAVAASFLLLAFLPSIARAQTIKAMPSTTSCSLDEVISINVKVTNPTQAGMPEAPSSPDYDILFLGGPSQMQQSTFINGRVSHEVSYTYHFELRPLRTGKFRVEPFTVLDGGRRLATDPFIVTVGRRIGSAADLICKVIAPRDTIFVGEPVSLTLEAWVRKYEQPDLGALSADGMFSRIESGACRFGIFADAAREPVRYREATLSDGQGRDVDYFVFIWETSYVAKSPGKLSFDDIQIAWSYPTRIRQTFFRIEDVRRPRHLRASPEADALAVKAVPLDGRPPYYSGAVGSFQMTARAAPAGAAVGDPVTLVLSVQGDVPLDGVSAPPLRNLPKFTEGFEVGTDSPAGEIRGETKIFTQTIRPLNENVREVPAIPFAYFNPVAESYETTWTDPIPLRVRPAERIAVPEDTGDETPPAATDIKETGGLQANHANIGALLANQSVRIGPGTYAVLGGLPIFYIAAAIVTQKRRRLQSDVGLRRRTRALADAKKRIARAHADRRLGDVQSALLTFIADRLNEPPGGMTRVEALQRMADRGIDEALRSQTDELLAAMEMSEYAGAAGIGVDEAAEQARKLIARLERATA